VAAVSDLALIILAPIEIASVILSSDLRGSCQIFTSVIHAFELEVAATKIPQELPMFFDRAEFCFKSLIASGQRSSLITDWASFKSSVMRFAAGIDESQALL